MFHRFLRSVFLSVFLFSAAVQVWSQPCPDTEPKITGPDVVCESPTNTVSYTTPEVTGHTYSWTVQRTSPGSGGWSVIGASNLAQFDVRWTGVGTYLITLTEGVNGSTCTAKQTTLAITVQPLLHAYFWYEYNPIGGCYFNLVRFYGNVSVSSDPITQYIWNFGDGTGDHIGTAIMDWTFPITGAFLPPYTFTATLTIINSKGQDMITDYIYVDPDKFKPDPQFTPAPLGCLYDGYQFDASASKPTHDPSYYLTAPIIHYIWDFGDGTPIITLPGNQPIYNHTFSSPGTYIITLTVENQMYCHESTVQTLIVASTIPTAAFTLSPACLDEITYFDPHTSVTPTGTTITDLIWDFGDGSATLTTHDPNQLVEHTYHNLGNPIAKLKVINNLGCVSEIVQHSVTIFRSPLANFDHGNACTGTPVVFTNTSQRQGGSIIVANHWTFGDGNESDEESPSYLYSGPGIYHVTLQVTNSDDCSNIKEDDILVSPNPYVDFTYAVGNTPLEIIFHDTLNQSEFVGNNLLWEFGDGQSGAGPDPTHTYPGPGDFIVTVVGTDMQTGCPTTVQHTVTVGGTPSAFFTANPPEQCQGQPISFIPGSPGGLILTEDWYFNDGSLPNPEHFDFPNTPAFPVHTFTSPNTYLVERYVNKGTSTEAYHSLFVTIDPQPGAQFTWFSDAALTNQGKACANQPVYFIDASYSNSTPPGNIYKWEWDFGDPGSGPENQSLQQNPTHTFNVTGTNPTTYTVRLIVTDNVNDCKDTITHPVIVNPPIPVDFTIMNNNACLDQLVYFTTDPVVLPPTDYTWLWEFGDGTTSTQPGFVSKIYPYVSIFTVRLTLTNQYGCANYKEHTVTIIPLPIANFTFTSPSCFGQPIQFTDLSSVPAPYPDIITGWYWDFGDGLGTSTQQNPIYVYPNFSPSGYDVILTVTTNRGCSSSKTYHVQPIPRPEANFEVQPLTPSCVDQPVQFHDLSQTNGGGDISTWWWDFGDPGSGGGNNSPAQNPLHTYNSAGTKSVTLTVTNTNGCNHTIIKSILISTLPVANFTTSEACQGTNMVFTDNSTTPPGTVITSYLWDFGDGSTSTQQNPQHPYNDYGSYIVTLTIVNSNQCINTIQKTVTVYANPIADFIFSSATCLGNPVTFTNQSTIPGTFSGYIIQWVWEFNDGSLPVTILYPNNPNVTHTFAGTANTHVVRLTVTTSVGCTSYIEKTVTSIPSPIASFSYSPIHCVGQLVQFTDGTQTNGGGNIQSWWWDFGDPLSGGSNHSPLQNPQHAFTSAQTYIVTLTVTSVNGCVNTYTDNQVIINALPVADFTFNDACEGNATTFTDASIPNAPAMATYSWNFGDGGSSNQQNPVYTFPSYGTYQVTLTVVNSYGCTHSVTKPVTVYPKPIAEFTFSSATCVGAPVNFYNQSFIPGGFTGYIDQWTWDFDDGSTPVVINWPGSPDVTHTFAGGGTVHHVLLTVHTTTGCTNSKEHTVTSFPSPIASFTVDPITCAGQIIHFTDHSQTNGGGAIQGWEWNFDDPTSGGSNISYQQHPTHIFQIPSTYDVQLIVTNINGCKDTVVMVPPLTINALPVAKFSATKECQGSATEFTDESTAPSGASIVTRLWDFDDGTTSNQTNPTHTFSNAGTYDVKLTVTTSQGCPKDTIIPVEVYQQPVAAFSFTAPSCLADSVYFTDLSNSPHGYICKWVWDFADGSATVTKTFPQSGNVTHKFNNGGTFNVILTITTTDSCTATKTLPVTINFAPISNFEFDAGPCALMPLQFTDHSQQNSGGPIMTWEWNFDDPGSGNENTSTLQNPLHAFSTGGQFEVFLKVTNANGCWGTSTKTVTVNDAPIAQFTSDTACMTSPTQFTDSSTTETGTTLIAWFWNFGDPSSGQGNTSTLQNPTHIFNTPGTYMVTLTVTNSNNCVNDTIIPISVNPKPVALFEYSASCVGDSTYFTDLSIAPGSQVVGWFWDFGDGTGTSDVQNPSYVYTVAGTYMVKLVVTNLSGCKDSVTMSVISRPKPTAAFTYVSFFCPPGLVNFQDQSTGTGSAIVARLWIFEPGNMSDLPNPQHTFPVTGMKYAVTLIVTDNFGCQDTIIDSVYVKPAFDFTFNNDTVCHGYTTHFHAINLAEGDSLYSVVWTFGDPNSPSNTSYLYNPTHTFTQPGMYIVKLKAWNTDNCVDSVLHVVQIYAPPEPAFSYLSEPCDSTIHFTDTTQIYGTGTIATWEWHFGDGTPPVIIPSPGPGDTSHLYVNAGIYPVTLIITNSNGCIDSVTTSVQRFPCIQAAYTYDDTLLCANYVISFADSSLPISRITQWHWIWGDGTPDTTYYVHASPIRHIFGAGGTYEVSLAVHAVVNGTTIIDSITRQVVIHPTPETYFSNIAVCLNQPTLFLDTTNSYGEPVTKWNWNFGDPSSGVNDTSSSQNPVHSYSGKGYYDVKLIVMNRFGCEDSITKPTRIYGLPAAHFENTVACTGDPTFFTDITVLSDTTIGLWRWHFGDSILARDTSTIQNPEYTYKYEGNYNVNLIVKDFFGCMDTVDSTITVNITPTSAFTFTDNFDGMQGKIKLNNQSDGATIYNWDFGNGKTSTEENPLFTYSEDGTYIIKLISLNEFGCSDTTFYEYKLKFRALYVPNAFSPTSDNLAVRYFKPVGMNLKQYHVMVFDTWGHMLWESTALEDVGNLKGVPKEGWDGTYNGELMPQGTYMWKVSATFDDDSPWNGADIGKGEYKTIGTLTLIR